MTFSVVKSALYHWISICRIFLSAEAAESSHVCKLLATLYSFPAFLPFLEGLSLDHDWYTKGDIDILNLSVVQTLGGFVSSDPDLRLIYGGSNMSII